MSIFAVVGLLLGFAELYDYQDNQLPDHDPNEQQNLFESCISNAKADGELTQKEYDRCAYSIYA